MKRLRLCTGQWVLIDDEDFERLSTTGWGMNSVGYARRTVRKNGVDHTQLMHRFILDAPADRNVDHINGDKLDNRRSNLRLCTQSQNQMNKRMKSGKVGSGGMASRYKGVYWHSGAGKWCAELVVNGKKSYLGLFENELEAAKRYDDEAARIFGEFARLNVVYPRPVTSILHSESEE